MCVCVLVCDPLAVRQWPAIKQAAVSKQQTTIDSGDDSGDGDGGDDDGDGDGYQTSCRVETADHN